MTDFNSQGGNSDIPANLPEINPNPVISSGPDGQLHFLNPATYRLLGDLQLDNARDILPENHNGIVKACLKTDTPLTDKRKVADHVFEWSYHPITESNIVYIYGHDVSGYLSDASLQDSAKKEEMPELNPSPVLSIKPDGTLQYLNPAASQLLQDLSLENIEEVLPTNHMEVIKTCLRTCAPLSDERKFTNRSFIWSYHPNMENNVIYIYGHETTDYQLSTTHANELPTANPSPVLSADADGNLKFINPAASHLLQELKLDDIQYILPGNHKGLVKACLKTNTPLTDECKISNHSLVWFYHPVIESDVVYIYGHDITGYLSKVSSTEFLPILNPSPVVSIGSDYEIIFINPAASRLLEDTKKKTIEDILPDNHKSIVATCMESNTPLTGECKVGKHTLVWSYHPINENNIIYIYGHDVSEYQ